MDSRRGADTKHALLKSLGHIGENGFGGVSSNGTSAPVAFGRLMANLLDNSQTIKRTYRELTRQKLITISHSSKDTYEFTLTPNGAYRLTKSAVDALHIPQMVKWDKKWRLVCFDIPKGKDKQRLYFNRRLHELGFTMVQRSLWVHPFDCFDTIKHITDFCNLTRYVTILVVQDMDELTKKKLEQHYRLSTQN